jgi:transposase
MPWIQTESMSERARFIVAFQEGCSMTELCERFSISRKTGYEWFNHCEADGLQGTNRGCLRPPSQKSVTSVVGLLCYPCSRLFMVLGSWFVVLGS